MKKTFKLAMIAISMVLAMSFAVHAQGDDSKKVDSKYVDQNDNCWTIYKDDSFEVSNEAGVFRTGMISKMAGLGASNITFIVTKELDKKWKNGFLQFVMEWRQHGQKNHAYSHFRYEPWSNYLEKS